MSNDKEPKPMFTMEYPMFRVYTPNDFEDYGDALAVMQYARDAVDFAALFAEANRQPVVVERLHEDGSVSKGSAFVTARNFHEPGERHKMAEHLLRCE